jgi:hypothetical protein
MICTCTYFYVIKYPCICFDFTCCGGQNLEHSFEFVKNDFSKQINFTLVGDQIFGFYRNKGSDFGIPSLFTL